MAGTAAWADNKNNYPATCDVNVGVQQEAIAAGADGDNRKERTVGIADNEKVLVWSSWLSDLKFEQQ